MKNNKKFRLYKFSQKQINHVFHYTGRFESLEEILMSGFIPSYCKESIRKQNYLTPMVSFCNIPISEVDKYMRYGKNGIGMSLDWAVKNGISPVTYFHNGSNIQLLLDGLNTAGKLDKNTSRYGSHFIIDAVAIKLLQNLKFWKTRYSGEDVVTYQEREWRYIPNLDEYSIIHEKYDIITYEEFLDKEKKPKPHLPDKALKIEKIEDIKYIVVTTELQRRRIIKTLGKIFTEEIMKDAILKGKISILTARQIRNDF